MEIEILNGDIKAGTYIYNENTSTLENKEGGMKVKLRNITYLSEDKEIGDVVFFTADLECDHSFSGKAYQKDYISLVTLQMKSLNQATPLSQENEDLETGESDEHKERKDYSKVAFSALLLTTIFLGPKVVDWLRAEDSNSFGYFTEEGICSASISAIMGRPVSIIKHDDKKWGIHYLHYVRAQDNTTWYYKCKIDENRVIWASNNEDSTGRWRDHDLDPIITFEVQNQTDLVIKEKYEDNSESIKSYFVFDSLNLTSRDKAEESITNIIRKVRDYRDISDHDLKITKSLSRANIPLAQLHLAFMYQLKEFKDMKLYNKEESERLISKAKSLDPTSGKRYEAIYLGKDLSEL